MDNVSDPLKKKSQEGDRIDENEEMEWTGTEWIVIKENNKENKVNSEANSSNIDSSKNKSFKPNAGRLNQFGTDKIKSTNVSDIPDRSGSNQFEIKKKLNKYSQIIKLFKHQGRNTQL